eukprot:801545_1
MASVDKKAKEYTNCVVCRTTASKVNLFMCIKDDCDIFGEIHCGRCGKIVHENMDHQFDIKSDHVKPVSFDMMKSNITKGNLAVVGTVGNYEEKK